jgi:hypothetical protein
MTNQLHGVQVSAKLQPRPVAAGHGITPVPRTQRSHVTVAMTSARNASPAINEPW